MAVPASYCHARLRETQFGPDDVHDPLPVAVQPGGADPELAAVAFEGGHHLLGQVVGEGPRLVQRRNDVVDRPVGPLRAGNTDAPPPQHVERLRRGDFMDQVEADKELGTPGRKPPDGVKIPDLLQQCLSHGGIDLGMAGASGPGDQPG